MELFPVLIHGYAIGFQRKPMYTVFKLENSHMVSFICESEITSATRKRRRHCYSTAIPYSLWLRRIDRLLCPRPHRTEALSDVARLTSVWHLSVCLSRTSGLSREQRGLGRLKLARGSPCHTWIGHHFQGQKVKGQLAGGGAYCGGLPHSLLKLTFKMHASGSQSRSSTFRYRSAIVTRS